MKYIGLLTTSLEEHIAKILPSKFPLIFDGWTLEGSSTHYVAIFARWFNDMQGIIRGRERGEMKEERLLCYYYCCCRCCFYYFMIYLLFIIYLLYINFCSSFESTYCFYPFT